MGIHGESPVTHDNSEQREAGPGSLALRLAVRIGIPTHDPVFEAAITATRNGEWATVTSISGSFCGDHHAQSDRPQLDAFFGRLPHNRGIEDAYAAIYQVVKFDGPTIPAHAFYGADEASRDWQRELLTSGQTFAVTGSKAGVTAGDYRTGSNDDPVRRLWMPMRDEQGALPGYYLLTAHAQNPLERAEQGTSTYVDFSVALTPYLEAFSSNK